MNTFGALNLLIFWYYFSWLEDRCRGFFSLGLKLTNGLLDESFLFWSSWVFFFNADGKIFFLKFLVYLSSITCSSKSSSGIFDLLFYSIFLKEWIDLFVFISLKLIVFLEDFWYLNSIDFFDAKKDFWEERFLSSFKLLIEIILFPLFMVLWLFEAYSWLIKIFFFWLCFFTLLIFFISFSAYFFFFRSSPIFFYNFFALASNIYDYSWKNRDLFFLPLSFSG